jgi:hypothetical protein
MRILDTLDLNGKRGVTANGASENECPGPRAGLRLKQGGTFLVGRMDTGGVLMTEPHD